MISFEIALDRLRTSTDNLRKRRTVLTVPDIEREVINNACLLFLKMRRERGDKDWNARCIYGNAIVSNSEAIPYAEAFARAAMILFPQQYGMPEANAAVLSVPMNVSWEGMWDFLKDYFQKYHGISIDNNRNQPCIFYSSCHKRYEHDVLITQSKVPRTINVQFINDRDEIIVSIEPTLSAKTGYLIEGNDNFLVYNGKDPDYRFTLTFDDFEEIETFVLEMPNRELKIIYS